MTLGVFEKATQVFQEIMATPDKGIPRTCWKRRNALPSFQERRRRLHIRRQLRQGVATCRTATGWSAPMFMAVGGGSFGFQIGASFTDVVMLFMNDHALHSLLGDKFKIGADVTVAAGPVGRQASANTDVRLDAEILSYSRSKGLFAGVSLDGAVVQADHSGDKAMYGSRRHPRGNPGRHPTGLSWETGTNYIKEFPLQCAASTNSPSTSSVQPCPCHSRWTYFVDRQFSFHRIETR
jgi:lipid-binding SYLF domain-containing protein